MTLPSRIGLSRVPNCATAYSLTGVGVASMTAEPDGEDGGGRRVQEAGDQVSHRDPGHGGEDAGQRERQRAGQAVSGGVSGHAGGSERGPRGGWLTVEA